MKTYSAKPSEIEKKWILIDAENLVVGRLASIVAMHLRGKHLPTFTPHMDMGDNVIVINAAKVKLTGRKLDQRKFFWHTGFPGGIKDRTQRQLLTGAHPERVVENAVRRMLPGGPLTRQHLRNLKVYAGAEHPHAAQQPKTLDVASMNTKNVRVDDLADTINSLEELGTLAPAVAAAPVYTQKLDAQGRAYATGKRKNAIARVWIKPGKGKIIVNGKEFNAFFARPVLQMILQQPIIAAARKDQYDVVATVSGGGLSGQAGAVRHGISKALTYFEPDLRGVLKKGGFLTRDSRVVERKKYGKAKARRSFQFSKR